MLRAAMMAALIFDVVPRYTTDMLRINDLIYKKLTIFVRIEASIDEKITRV